jgi:hypothetical protein
MVEPVAVVAALREAKKISRNGATDATDGRAG